MDSSQLYFSFPENFDSNDLIIGTFNLLATNFLFKNTHWLSPVVYIYGEEGVGKTLISKIYLQKYSGILISTANLSNFNKLENIINKYEVILLDNLHTMNTCQEEVLFHLYNFVLNTNKKLIITSPLPPNALDISLPDLKSRLQAATLLFIDNPDEISLMAIFIKLLSNKQLVITKEVLEYLFKRIQRSPARIIRVVEAIEQYIMKEKKTITIHNIKNIIDISSI